MLFLDMEINERPEQRDQQQAETNSGLRQRKEEINRPAGRTQTRALVKSAFGLARHVRAASRQERAACKSEPASSGCDPSCGRLRSSAKR